jgi:hypothetical protein
MVFEMTVVTCTDDRLDIDFHYCPLVAARQSHGATDEQIARLCDIAMQGDRGVAGSFGCELDLGETIAKGYGKCEILPALDRRLDQEAYLFSLRAWM